MKLTVHTQEKKEKLGDLYGIFFEDINYAADGGLYGELIQNRAFEYSSLDHAQFRPLYAWEKLELGGRMDWQIKSENPVSRKNPHYLVLNITEEGSVMGVRNIGFNQGICIKKGERYLFSCYAKICSDTIDYLNVAITDAKGTVLCSQIFGEKDTVSNEERNTWKKYEKILESDCDEYCGRLQITVKGIGKTELDFVSLFPEDTYKNRKNGMRKDIAEMLADLKPKFMRFPGGCLVHDGSLNPEERDSMYRWKNTIGPLTERSARRNNWCYHQTLGLGYYEYFLFCEDIGAKPLPVLPAGYNPHSAQAVPFEEMQPWIDDALDLIEFANGSEDTKWGKIRSELGHPEPFGLEYLAIGNEEDAAPFFERYTLFHEAIKKKYPMIKLINSAGPFPAGEVYERGWKSARENRSDFIDEHYYQSPEWFLSNTNRYDTYQSETKVFLGEYASKDNCWYNALAEAAYMTGLEKNAKGVGLACYAPLLCNVDYVRWDTNLIWFNGHQVYGTPNYYVQKLFMNHQGSELLACSLETSDKAVSLEKNAEYISGRLGVESHRSDMEFSGIFLRNLDTGEEKEIDSFSVGKDENFWFGEQKERNYTVRMNVCQHGEGYGFTLIFGGIDEKNNYRISFGGWGNADLFIDNRIDGRNANLMQKCFKLYADRTYQLELRVQGRNVEVFVDGKKEIETFCTPFVAEPVYYSASIAENGDILIKLVNGTQISRRITCVLEGIEQAKGTVFVMEGYERDAKNSFEEPTKVVPREESVLCKHGVIDVILPEDSIRIYRITPEKIGQ